MKSNFVRLSLALAAIASSSAVSTSAIAATTGISYEQIAAAIRKYPELITEALETMQSRQRDEQAKQLAQTVKPVAEKILAGDTKIQFLGNPSGTAIIEFFDYNCGYCKRFHAETATPLLAEGRTKILMVHTPILGEGSERMAELSAAAGLQGKFEAAHDFLMERSAKSVEDANAMIPDLIKATGLDKARFEKALTDGSAKAVVDHSIELSKTAGVSGTPLIYANNQAIPGAIPLGPLKQTLSN